MGNGSSGTFGRPPSGIGNRFNDLFKPRKIEFKDGSQTTNNAVTKGSQTPRYWNSLETYTRCCQRNTKKKKEKELIWDQTRKEQETRPTKLIVSKWFKNETNLPTMVGMLDTIKQELKKVPYKLHGQEVPSRLEMSQMRKPLAKAHALFYEVLKEVGGDESKIHVVYGIIQISFFVGGAMAAKYTP